MRSPGDAGDDSSGERILRSKKSDGPIIALLDAVRVGRREGAVRDLHWISIAGTVVNFVAGRFSRALVFVRRLGLKWLWRIKEEPVLWRRYAGDASALSRLMVMRVLPGLTYRVLGVFAKRNAPPRILVDGGDGPTRLTLADSWSESDLSLLQKTLEMVTLEPVDIEVDVIDQGRIDGAFIGTLMLLYGHQCRD